MKIYAFGQINSDVFDTVYVLRAQEQPLMPPFRNETDGRTDGRES